LFLLNTFDFFFLSLFFQKIKQNKQNKQNKKANIPFFANDSACEMSFAVVGTGVGDGVGGGGT